ncbi:MAG: AlwI family type II restriction endonuclease [Bacteroidales bacterium]|nr:AlwI family type II restriction endonuclease [Bacteroidales bacterium]
MNDLHISYGVATDIRSALVEENRQKLEVHIQEKYPQEKIVELLRMISNRQNDKKIKQYVNEDATVPTIYEFIIAIAWYYISDRKISVYDSLNLTLNGDFEPVIHAGGGAGDIVVKYTDKIVMLEATLMNAAAQKRGEWEPVLRHAINLTAESYPQRVFTLFVADTLDYNTINIWRAVAAVTLESSITGEKTEHVIIMPFTNEHLCHFIENSISDDRIIAAIDNSYDEIKANFDDTWHDKIIATL